MSKCSPQNIAANVDSSSCLPGRRRRARALSFESSVINFHRDAAVYKLRVPRTSIILCMSCSSLHHPRRYEGKQTYKLSS